MQTLKHWELSTDTLVGRFRSKEIAMRGRIPSNVVLRPDDLALLERVFAQVIPEHDTHPDELAMLLVRLFQDGLETESELLTAAKKWFR